MLRAHKIALQPNNQQATYLSKASGVARFAYNWGLSEWQKQYEAFKVDGRLKRPTQQALRRQLNAIKRSEYPWMLDVTKNAPQMALIQLGMAFKNFFAGRARYPTYRKKGQDDRFTLSNDQFAVEGSRIRIPHIGFVRMREALRFEGKRLSATISCRAGRWYVSIAVERRNQTVLKTENQGVVGIDLGLTRFVTLSTGESPMIGKKPYQALLNRLRRLSRALSRKQKGSINRNKAKIKLARLHARIADIRQDALHQLTTAITRRFSVIGLEDLNVTGMMRNRRLSRSIADMSFREFRRQVEYKACARKGQVVVADRWFASSKLCSVCHYKHTELSLSVRQWRCTQCAAEHDRDFNAAVNLKHYAVSSTVSACGGEGSSQYLSMLVKPAPMKQEVNAKSYL